MLSVGACRWPYRGDTGASSAAALRPRLQKSREHQLRFPEPLLCRARLSQCDHQMDLSSEIRCLKRISELCSQ